MKRLVEAGQIKTKGERRGIQHWAGVRRLEADLAAASRSLSDL